MIKGKRVLLAQILQKTKILDLLGFQRRDRLVILNYHRIRPNSRNFSTPFDENVYGPTAHEFENHLQWLKKHASILSENDLLNIIATGKMPKGLSALITFDDGYIDNYTMAYPVLKKLDVPAIFFIPTLQITERQLGWWDIIAYLLKRCTKPSISLHSKKFNLETERGKAIHFFSEKMKIESYKKTENLVTELANTCEVILPDQEMQGLQLMAWEQVREVSKKNITIGGHSHSHKVLATLNPEDQKRELSISKAILEKETGQPVRSIAYPVGNAGHFTPETQRIAEKEGYKLGFSFCNETNHWGAIDSFNIKRISAPRDLSLFEASAVFPQVFLR